MLRNVKVISDDEVGTDIVSVGSTVVVYDLDLDEEVSYTIVGSAESDPLENKISNESPVGEALLGKKRGDVVEVQVPAGVIRYKIVDIQKQD